MIVIRIILRNGTVKTVTPPVPSQDLPSLERWHQLVKVVRIKRQKFEELESQPAEDDEPDPAA